MSGKAPKPVQPLATEAEVAAWMSMSPRQLAELRLRGEAPPHIAFSRKAIRYAWPEVFAHANARRGLALG